VHAGGATKHSAHSNALRVAGLGRSGASGIPGITEYCSGVRHTTLFAERQ